jgi:hypothetical protein
MLASEVQRVMKIRHDAIEVACEQALQGGVCGVLVVEESDSEWLVGPHSSVPYGHIYYAPSGYRPDA